MIGSLASPFQGDLIDMFGIKSSFWPPPWSLLILVAIGLGFASCWYCKKHCINIYVLSLFTSSSHHNTQKKLKTNKKNNKKNVSMNSMSERYGPVSSFLSIKKSRQRFVMFGSITALVAALVLSDLSFKDQRFDAAVVEVGNTPLSSPPLGLPPPPIDIFGGVAIEEVSSKYEDVDPHTPMARVSFLKDKAVSLLRGATVQTFLLSPDSKEGEEDLDGIVRVGTPKVASGSDSVVDLLSLFKSRFLHVGLKGYDQMPFEFSGRVRTLFQSLDQSDGGPSSSALFSLDSLKSKAVDFLSRATPVRDILENPIKDAATVSGSISDEFVAQTEDRVIGFVGNMDVGELKPDTSIKYASCTCPTDVHLRYKHPVDKDRDGQHLGGLTKWIDRLLLASSDVTHDGFCMKASESSGDWPYSPDKSIISYQDGAVHYLLKKASNPTILGGLDVDSATRKANLLDVFSDKCVRSNEVSFLMNKAVSFIKNRTTSLLSGATVQNYLDLKEQQGDSEDGTVRVGTPEVASGSGSDDLFLLVKSGFHHVGFKGYDQMPFDSDPPSVYANELAAFESGLVAESIINVQLPKSQHDDEEGAEEDDSNNCRGDVEVDSSLMKADTKVGTSKAAVSLWLLVLLGFISVILPCFGISFSLLHSVNFAGAAVCRYKNLNPTSSSMSNQRGKYGCKCKRYGRGLHNKILASLFFLGSITALDADRVDVGMQNEDKKDTSSLRRAADSLRRAAANASPSFIAMATSRTADDVDATIRGLRKKKRKKDGTKSQKTPKHPKRTKHPKAEPKDTDVEKDVNTEEENDESENEPGGIFEEGEGCTDVRLQECQSSAPCIKKDEIQCYMDDGQPKCNVPFAPEPDDTACLSDGLMGRCNQGVCDVLPWDDLCHCHTCSDSIINRMATDYKGESGTCGDRIHFLTTVEGGSELLHEACTQVGYEFPSICGGCQPCCTQKQLEVCQDANPCSTAICYLDSSGQPKCDVPTDQSGLEQDGAACTFKDGDGECFQGVCTRLCNKDERNKLCRPSDGDCEYAGTCRVYPGNDLATCVYPGDVYKQDGLCSNDQAEGECYRGYCPQSGTNPFKGTIGVSFYLPQTGIDVMVKSPFWFGPIFVPEYYPNPFYCGSSNYNTVGHIGAYYIPEDITNDIETQDYIVGVKDTSDMPFFEWREGQKFDASCNESPYQTFQDLQLDDQAFEITYSNGQSLFTYSGYEQTLAMGPVGRYIGKSIQNKVWNPEASITLLIPTDLSANEFMLTGDHVARQMNSEGGYAPTRTCQHFTLRLLETLNAPETMIAEFLKYHFSEYEEKCLVECCKTYTEPFSLFNNIPFIGEYGFNMCGKFGICEPWVLGMGAQECEMSMPDECKSSNEDPEYTNTVAPKLNSKLNSWGKWIKHYNPSQCWGDGTTCVPGISCSSCCNGSYDASSTGIAPTYQCGDPKTHACWGDDTLCVHETTVSALNTCNKCCNGFHMDPTGIFAARCGDPKKYCWGDGTTCVPHTSCGNCCNGSYIVSSTGLGEVKCGVDENCWGKDTYCLGNALFNFCDKCCNGSYQGFFGRYCQGR